MEREQIIKALECCKDESINECAICPYNVFMNCDGRVRNDAFSLIKELTEELEKERIWADSMIDNLRDDIRELTEENDRLEKAIAFQSNGYDELHQKAKADTVRKMQSDIKAQFCDMCEYSGYDIHRTVDQIAKERLEESLT